MGSKIAIEFIMLKYLLLKAKDFSRRRKDVKTISLISTECILRESIMLYTTIMYFIFLGEAVLFYGKGGVKMI